MRKVVLYIAKSLDGYIADSNGGVEWLTGQEKENIDSGSYPEFIKTVDTVILGYKPYHQVITELSPDYWVYSRIKSYVITSKNIESTDEIIFTNENLSRLISNLKNQEWKDIWICGGASIVNQLLKLNLIDEFYISIIPIILGNGIPLFEEYNKEIKLELINTRSYNGIVDLQYRCRKSSV